MTALEGRSEGAHRGAEAAAIAGALLTAAVMAAAWYLAALNGNIVSQLANNPGPDLIVPIGVTTVGAVLVARRPRNIVGWLFLASGVIVAVRCLAEEYTVRGLLTSATLPGLEWSSWLSNWLIGLIFPTGTFLFALLLFPNGHLLSRRWRPLAWAAVALAAFSIFLYVVDPNESRLVSSAPEPANPLAIKGLPLSAENASWLWPLGMLLLVTATVSLVIRYRRAGGEERQQLKWFAFAAVTTIVFVAAAFLLTIVLPQSVADLEFNIVIIGGIGIAIPIALGVAILKYRLYGIDLVISRTLVYGTLAVLITGIYVGIAVGIGELVGAAASPTSASPSWPRRSSRRASSPHAPRCSAWPRGWCTGIAPHPMRSSVSSRHRWRDRTRPTRCCHAWLACCSRGPRPRVPPYGCAPATHCGRRHAGRLRPATEPQALSRVVTRFRRSPVPRVPSRCATRASCSEH